MRVDAWKCHCHKHLGLVETEMRAFFGAGGAISLR